jgi:carbamoyl-phosphate synthase large subunit
MAEGRPHIVDMIKNGEMDLIINTVEDKRSAIHDSYSIRHAVLQARATYYTTLAGARAACIGMANMRELEAYSLQKLHSWLRVKSLGEGCSIGDGDSVLVSRDAS